MALPALARNYYFYKSIKSATDIAATQHIFINPSISAKFYKPDLSPDSKVVVDRLVLIFTSKSVHDGNRELGYLGSKVTTEIVEFVLKGIRNWRIALNFFDWASNQTGYSHNCYTFNAMAAVLAGVRQNAQLKNLSSQVVSSQCCMSPGALGFFIRCLGSVGLVEEANSLFDHVRQLGLCVPNNYSYNCLLDAISNSNSVDLAERRLNEMLNSGWEADRYTLTPLLQVYCRAGQFEKALNVFNHMCANGWVDLHISSILLMSFSKWGKAEEALELIERIKDFGVELNEKTFHVLIHGFVSSLRLDKAILLLEKMRHAGISPDIALYDVLIGGFCKSKDIEKALCLYSEMKKYGIAPDLRILTKLISSVGEETLMLQLIEETGIVIDSELVTLVCNSILNALVGKGSIDRAHYLMKVLMGYHPSSDKGLEKFFKVNGIVGLNATSFNIVIDALCKTGQLDAALGLFRDMVRIGCKKDALLYNNLIDTLCKCDRLEDSLELLQEMKMSGVKPTQFTYNAIYGCFCKREDVEGAIEIVKEMFLSGHEPWIKHSTTMVTRLCKLGKANEASKFLDKLVEEGLVPHLIPYSAAIDGYFKLKQVDHALELFRDMCARGYSPDVITYNILINGLCKAQRMIEAWDLFKEMLKRGLVPSVVTYNSIINGWCKFVNINQALVCFYKMAKQDRYPNVVTYTTLIDGLCNAGRSEHAVLLWNEMLDKGCTPNRVAFMALINGLCKSGKPQLAMSYLREMKEKELSADGFVYVALVDAFMSKDDAEMAFDIFKEIIEQNMLPDSNDKNHAMIKDAVSKLLQDPRTSSSVGTLITTKGMSAFLPPDV